MKTLRYWYKAIPPQLSKKNLVPHPNDLAYDVVRCGSVVGTVGADEAKRLASWRMEPVVWEKKHGA